MADGSVLLIANLPDLATLYRQVLEEDGLQVDVALDPPDIVSEVKARAPAVIVLHLVPAPRGDTFAPLDALNSDPDTRDVPVVVATGSQELADEAQAGYNVAVAHTIPLDIDDLIGAVRAAMLLPRPDSRPVGDADGLLAAVINTMREHGREAVFRWVQRLQREAPWSERQDLGLGALIDHMPSVFELICQRLAAEVDRDELTPIEEAVGAIRHHAQLRREQGFALPAVLHEYIVMREEISDLFRRYAPPADVDELLSVEQRINLTLDLAVEQSAEEYEAAPPPGA